MSINTLTLNTELVDGLGELDLGSGLIVSVEQTQEFRDNGSGLIISFEQSIQNSISSTLLISFEQSVENPSASTFFSRNGWYPIFTIDGWQVPHDQLTGQLIYNHSESNNAILEFSIIPPLGIQDLFKYQGQTVTCDVRVASGTYRIFTGIIDIPEADVMMERITFRCSDNREERIVNGEAGSPSLIGNYSTTVFGIPIDTKTEVLDRLKTIPYSLDWDGYGIKHLTSWTPKATADYTLGDGTVYRTEPTIRVEARGTLINTVNIDFTYTYQRFHEQLISYVWEVPYSTGYFLLNSPSLCSKQMVRAAISSTSWDVIGDIGFTPILTTGLYNVNGTQVVWSTTEVSGTMVAKTNTNPTPGGDPIPVLDASGNQVYEAVPTSSTDLSDLYCFGAAWNAGKRYSQTISETYTLSVKAPQSISQYGTVEQNQSYTLVDEDRGSGWDGSKATGTTSSYTDQDLNLIEFNNASTTFLNIAKTNILQAHRDSRVTFDVFIWPELDLRHTVELTTGRIQCKGKVSAIKHECSLDFTNPDKASITTVELALYRGIGSQTESSLVPPTRPTDTFTASDGAIALQSHYGEDPSVPAAKYWTGHIGNIYKAEHSGSYINYTRTTYPESFVIDTPAAPDSQRLQRVLTATQNYNIAIPNNNLIWTTIGK